MNTRAETTHRLRPSAKVACISGQQAGKKEQQEAIKMMMSYCIIRCKLKKQAKEDAACAKPHVTGSLAAELTSRPPRLANGIVRPEQPAARSSNVQAVCAQVQSATSKVSTPVASASASAAAAVALASQTLAISHRGKQAYNNFNETTHAGARTTWWSQWCSLGQSTALEPGGEKVQMRRTFDTKNTNTTATITTTTGRRNKINLKLFVVTLIALCLAPTNWAPSGQQPGYECANGRDACRQHPSVESISPQALATIFSSAWLLPGIQAAVSLLDASRNPSMMRGMGMAKAEYQPEWPSKVVQQEIFLLNLEDGYFGCQVNESQDFLQLFELSRLCDGQAQCYLGTDEMALPLKCKDRERCGSQPNSRGQMEPVQCVNGVCLDGLCYCNDGFGGKSCDVPDENECKFRPCDVFAHCTNTMGSYYCSCFPDINECEIPSLAALCSDNSECCNLPGHFVCKCKPGYQQSSSSQSLLTGAPSGNTSVLCTDIDECLDERTCGRGASCENLPGSFRCSCPPGFTGDPLVECIDMDECRNNPCGAGAQCTNIPGGYRCSCAPGFERNPSLPAELFGTIQSTTSTLSNELATTNSSLIACLDVNECAPGALPGGKPACGQGAQCINTAGAYFCQCPPNYTGNAKVACVDIDECANHACGTNSQCKNIPGSYKCECKPGYTGNSYLPEGCQDEDECQTRKDACGLNAQCFNTLGSYQCSCPTGYTGDPYTRCLDIDECFQGAGAQGPCGPGAQCVNLEGGFKCTCPDKFLARGTPEMGCERAAVDIGCQADYDCTQNAACLNSTCQCKLGYQAKGIDCIDVDECSLSQPLTPPQAVVPKPFTKLNSAANLNSQQHVNSSLNILCGPEALCHNTDGSFRCDCRPGYEKLEPASLTSKCRDINECDQNPCGQNSRCFNTDGSYKCACSEGFIPIDQEQGSGCKSPCDGVNCGPHASCKPQGEEAACVCKPGFTFDPSNIKLGCVDINECDPNYGPAGLCGQRAVCTNVPGAYRCSCPPGYTGDAYRYCEDINECDRKFGVFGQCGELAICNNTQGSFNCACAPGYSGDPRVKCHDIDECNIAKFGPNGKCGPNAQCSNAPGKFTCRCAPNHSGDPYDLTNGCEPEQAPCSSAADCAVNQVCQAGRCNCPFSPVAPSGEPPRPDEPCRHPCERTECGPHATCQLDSDNQAICVCDSGYMAPSDGRSGCVDVNECIVGSTYSGITPISALNSPGRGGSVALGPVTVTPPNSQGSAGTNGSHPCGRNALCRNQPGSFDCVCPPGYSGNAYEACQLDVRNQQVSSTVSAGGSTSTSGSVGNLQQQQAGAGNNSGFVGNYQQEPRTTGCSEPCQRGLSCFDGQCVRPDSCRDNLDCRLTQACEHVNQALGFQCVNVCELNQCGPEAKCTPLNHKPICSCNSSAGFAGDPYDLVIGCQLQATLTSSSSSSTTSFEHQQQQTSTTSSSFSQQQQLSTLTAKQEQTDLHRTTVATNLQQQQQSSDLSTSSFDLGPAISNQQQQQAEMGATSSTSAATLGGQVSTGGNSTSLEQLQRQQQQYYEHQREQQQQQQTRRPNQPILAYELPLPTTPILPQFSQSIGQQTQTQQQQQATATTSQQGSLSGTSQQGQQQQTNQQLIQSPTSGPDRASTQVPQLTQTTAAANVQSSGTTQSRQQQQSVQNLFSNKRKQQQQQQQLNMISNNQQLSTANRQDTELQANDNFSEQRQKQQQQDEQMQLANQQQQQQQNLIQNQQQQQNDDLIQGFNQLSNKSSAIITNFIFAHKQVACTSDQHCPGNLFCLDASVVSDQQPFIDSGAIKSSAGNPAKICGCPANYKREADYCFMHRVNCTSSALCKAREECISSQVLQQYYAANSLPGSASQLVLSSQQFSLNSVTSGDNGGEFNGICVCPRGYKLTATGIACIDRNECDEGTPCAVGAICQNKIGSYECVCPPGTIGEPYTKTCDPIVNHRQTSQSSSSLSLYECQSNADCANDRECDLTAQRCVSPCKACGPRAICTAANHVAICLCPPRYTGNAIDLVYGCQEPIPLTTTTTTTTTTSTTTSKNSNTLISHNGGLAPTSTTTGRPSNQVVTQTPSSIGVPFTTLLPAIPTTTLAPPESTTPELVEFRTIPPSELFVMCLADGIQVEVQLGGFDGIIYVKGHSQDPKCRKLVMSSNANEFIDFKVQFGHCDLIHRDGEAGFVLVIQKHPKLVTYRARAYHVKCVYNTGERTVTLGFNVSMITTSGTIANTGPPPTCLMSITALDGREVTSAEIGQDLLLRVDVQPDSIYGGFARSCEAKTLNDEGGEYQYEVTDANGCATDASIFSDWKYDQHRKSLVARFNAFKFPSSNQLRFQCNIRVCFGSCPAVNCNGIDAYGRRRRRRRDANSAALLDGPSSLAGNESLYSTSTGETDLNNNDNMNSSGEDTPTDELIVTDAFKEGALREEIMVQSNAILTFDKKEASLPQQRQHAPVEDIEFVCLPRLGIIMSIVLTTLLALLALAIATSCWCFAKRKRQNRSNGPLPHPVDFPNPLLRSTSVSKLHEPIYGP